MGDLIMSGPAIRALKETTGARITVLTSSMATLVAGFMEEIDEVITFDFPWVKNSDPETSITYHELIETIRARNFDAAVVFTVYSQNPLPAVMLTYMAGIPNRLAYCRENPYQLLTHWVPDPEPYTYIRHQVRRDLDLVAHIGASTINDGLHLQTNPRLWAQIENNLTLKGFDPDKKWLILHAGVSEAKREFPVNRWVETAQQLIRNFGYQVILTGSEAERQLTDQLQHKIGHYAFSTGGLFSIEELITLISKAPVMLTVNTGTVHIAAAVGTPVVVLYALTNPQHTPWKVPCQILPYKVKLNLHSKNEVIKHVNQFFYKEMTGHPTTMDIISAVNELLTEPDDFLNQELYLIELMQERVSLN
ncbi:MAG: Lipopolysaccharide heptosyltransferase [Mucilaginibacter sp.]|nr:Lipopolysaccharide heptosyltransferase [Mucilaginibacter sp.]